MTSNLFRIPGPWRGRLAIVARPRGGDWLADEARGWRAAGIDAVVSLLEPAEAEQLGLFQEQEAAEANAIRFISFPIPDRGVPASLPGALALIADIARALDRGENVALHCRQSVGRAGLIAAGVLTSVGVPAQEAMETVSLARGVTVPETSGQDSWLRRLPFARQAVPG